MKHIKYKAYLFFVLQMVVIVIFNFLEKVAESSYTYDQLDFLTHHKISYT